MRHIVDIHNHYINNVDDGAQSVKMSMDMLRQAAERGITDIVATPHQLERDQLDPLHHRQDVIIENLEKLKEEVVKEKLPINLYLGGELYYSRSIPDVLNVKYFTYENKKKYALVEFSMSWAPEAQDRIFYELMQQDCTPILAHPERYSFFWDFTDEIIHLLKMGTLLQINAGSLLGYQGTQAYYVSHLLLKKGLAHVIASDAHRPRKSNGFNMTIAADMCKTMYPDLDIDSLISENPWNILQGLPISIDDEPFYNFNTNKEYKLWRRFKFKYDYLGIGTRAVKNRT